jgi:hypothetical protein
MGSWSVYCNISQISITSGQKCVILPLKENKEREGYDKFVPACLPIFGEYNDYGGMEEIEEDDNTKLIEEHLGVKIDKFVEFLVDGKFTYDRSEIKPIKAKLEKNGSLEEIQEWRFMWIDRQVYDFMIKNLDNYHKGYMDYGTPEMLKLFGFEKIEDPGKIKNYDPKRFNQVWSNGNIKMFSDGRTLLTDKDRYVYHFGKGDETSIETYFEVPENLHYLKNISKQEAWRLMPKRKQKYELAYIFGQRYGLDFDFDDGLLERIREFTEALAKKTGEKTETESRVIEKILEKKKENKKLYLKYFDDMESFGDRIVHLINVRHNMHCMSGTFSPHQLYLTPQCGEYTEHQVLLEKFAEINKSRCKELGGFEDE